MDAKPLAPAEIAGLLRDESAGLFFPEGADCLDAQAVEIIALRARVAGLEGALRTIATPGYGLQGIQEDYGHDTNAYNYHAGKYFTDQYFGLQKIARAALSPSAQEAPDAE